MRTLRSLRMRHWLVGAVMALALGCSVLVLSTAQPAQAAAGRPVTVLLAVVIVLIITVGCTCALAWWLGYDQGYLAARAYRKAEDEVEAAAIAVVDNVKAPKAVDSTVATAPMRQLSTAGPSRWVRIGTLGGLLLKIPR
jgi:hypothetical protein